MPTTTNTERIAGQPPVDNADSETLQQLAEVVERCMQPTPVMVQVGDKQVQLENEAGIGIWTFDALGACKALESIGKRIGFFDKHYDQLVPVLVTC